MLTTFDRTRDGKIVAAFRLEKDELQPKNETWSSKRSVNCRRLSYDNTENHAAASVLPLTRRFRKHESARTSPAVTHLCNSHAQPQLRRERAVRPPRRQTGALGTAAPQPRSTSTGTELSTSPCRGQRGSKRDGGTLCEAGTARPSTQTGASHAAQRPACDCAIAGGVWALGAMQAVPPRPNFVPCTICSEGQ